jgi:hypothetical protein
MRCRASVAARERAGDNEGMSAKWQFSLSYLLWVVFWIASALGIIRVLLPRVMPATLIGLFPAFDPATLAPVSLVLIALVIVCAATTAGVGIGNLSGATKFGAVLGTAVGSAIAAVLVSGLLLCVYLENGWPF